MNKSQIPQTRTQIGSLTLGGGDVVGAAAWLAAGLVDAGLLYAVRDESYITSLSATMRNRQHNQIV